MARACGGAWSMNIPMPVPPHQPPSPDDERDLIARLRRGDQDALDAILRRWGGRVRRALFLRFGDLLNEQDLEDVMSVGLFRVWETRADFDPGKAKLETWFYILSRNAAVELLRTRSRQIAPAQVRDLETVPGDAAAEVEPGTASEPSPPVAALARAVAEALTPRERRVVEAFVAADGNGPWAAAVADELGLAPQHVRVIRLRAFEKLRRAMAEKGTGAR